MLRCCYSLAIWHCSLATTCEFRKWMLSLLKPAKGPQGKHDLPIVGLSPIARLVTVDYKYLPPCSSSTTTTSILHDVTAR